MYDMCVYKDSSPRNSPYMYGVCVYKDCSPWNHPYMLVSNSCAPTSLTHISLSDFLFSLTHHRCTFPLTIPLTHNRLLTHSHRLCVALLTHRHGSRLHPTRCRTNFFSTSQPHREPAELRRCDTTPPRLCRLPPFLIQPRTTTTREL